VVFAIELANTDAFPARAVLLLKMQLSYMSIPELPSFEAEIAPP
jgi:hypothetical protein